MIRLNVSDKATKDITNGLKTNRLSAILAEMPSEQPKRRAYSNIRFSSAKQEQGDSVRRQTNLLNEVLKLHPDWILDETPLRDLGISAWSGANIAEGALGTFIAAVEAGKIEKGSILIIEQWDRLTRLTAVEAMELFSRITRRGIDICTSIDKKIHNRESMKDIGSLLESILKMQLANEESNKKSIRIKEAWTTKRESGKVMTTQGPAWLKWNGQGWEIIPERAAVVKEIFQLTVAGRGRSAICNILNGRKEPTFGDGVCGWWSAYVSKLLRNESVIGRWQAHKLVKDENGKETSVPDGEPREGYFPRIISDALWQKVQSRIADCKKVVKGAKNPGAGRPTLVPVRNLFTGLLFDGYHPENQMILGGGHDGLVSNWHRLNPNSGTPRITWDIEELEDTILKYLSELDYRQLTQSEPKVSTEEIRLAEAQTKLDAVTKRAEQLMDNLETCDDKEQRGLLMRRLKERAAEKTTLETEVSRLKASFEAAKAKDAALSDGKRELAKLRICKDEESRLRIKAEIRRLVNRIDLFPRGDENFDFASNPFVKITFQNGAHRLISEKGFHFEYDEGAIAKLIAKIKKNPKIEENQPG